MAGGGGAGRATGLNTRFLKERAGEWCAERAGVRGAQHGRAVRRPEGTTGQKKAIREK